MVKKTKGKHRLDKYYHLAKEQGYRSRAAFKLIQLNRKYGFLQNCKALLDLCAAPGGWMQVAAKNMPLSSLIIGVDLAPIKPIRGTRSYISDITTAQCRQLLKKEAAGSLFDVVLHDGAPNVGGAWSSEAYTQSVLVADALALAVEFLAPGGTFVTKVFRSKDYNALLYAFGQLFKKVEATKPQASRNASAEIFVVCLGYKAPAKVDPRLLDPKHLFMEVAEAPKVMGPEALLKQKIKQKRHREGYDEGLSSSHKVASAVSFLLSGNAVEMLGQVTRLALEGTAAEQTEPAEGEEEQQGPADVQALAAAVRSHPSTDGEIKALCSDLQVLGRSEFKQLLRWRLGLRRDLKALLGGGAAAEDEAKKGSHKKQQQQQDGEGDEEEGGEQEDAETKLLAEMEAIKDAAEKRVRKEKRKRREVKKKAKVRTAQLLAAEGGEDNSGAPDDEQLFGLGVLDAAAAGIAADKGGSSKAAAAAAAAASVLKKVSSAAAPGAREMEMLEAPDEDELWSDDDSDASSLDSDDAALHYEAELEEQLDNAYASYLERKGVRDAAAKEKRQRLGKGGELVEGEEEDGAAAAGADAGAADSESDDPEEYGARLQQEAEEASEDEAAAAAGAGGGLLVQLDTSRAGVAKGGAAAAAQWFGQDLFEDPNVDVSSDEEEEQQQQQRQQKIQLKRQKKQAPESAAAVDTEQQQQSSKRQKTGANANGVANGSSAGYDSGNSSGEDRGSDSEIGASDSEAELDSDEEEFNALDDHAKAEVLALAKKMLRRKDKDSIVEAAYNRYAFHDDKLPRWFAEDESRHMRPLPQVTKEDIEAEKARLAAIDARPIKKVAQAKARKQKRLQVRLDAARAKATSIAAQDDVPMSSKMREIEKVYAKAKAGKGAKGKGKGGKAAGGRKGKGPPLDGRMRKDKRGLDKAAARKKGPKGKGGVRKKGGRR